MSRRLLALAIAAACLAPALAACSRDSVTVKATFDDVGDLQARHSVQVADVRVGQIRKIELTDDFKAEVTLTLAPRHRIPRRSQALLRTTSLLGEKFIELRALGEPGKGPFLADGDVIAETGEAPELEFVAQEAVEVLGSVVATDVATLVETGAAAFGGRRAELSSLIGDLATISATFASRTQEINRIIDGLDRTSGTLAEGSDQIAHLLTNLAEATTVLAQNRDRAIVALDKLTDLAEVQGGFLDRYRTDIDRQIKQVDAIVGVAVTSTGELSTLIDWLRRFTLGTPKVIQGDFTQVYGWFIPSDEDPRSP